MQRNTGYFPTESLEPSGNRLFSRSALNEGYLFRGSQKTCTFCGACPALKFDTKILCGADCYADLRLHIEAQKESRGNSSK